MKKEKKGEKKPIYAIIYARVASGGEESISSVERQLIECRKFARARGFILEKDSEYSETYSGIGKYEHRPGLQEILQQIDKARERTFVVIVSDASRIARNYEQYESYKAALGSRGVWIESVKTSFDANPDEQLQRDIQSAMSRYEYSMRHQRAVAAIRQKAGK